MSLPSNANLQDYLQFAKRIALSSGDLMVKYKDTPKPYPNNHKYINEYVAEIIEQHIKSEIEKSYPEHSLFMKNSQAGEYEWICDYIDGAYAYSKNHKISVTSVSLVYKNKTIVAAVYDPWSETMYSATIGNGFYVNNKLVSYKHSKNYQGSLVDVEWWPNATYDVDSWLHQFSLSNDVYVLHIGSVIHAACLVANGVFSAAILGKFMSGKNHEISAIKLIIEEAGCILTDLNGNDITHVGDIEGLVFANKSIHKDLISSYAKFKV